MTVTERFFSVAKQIILVTDTIGRLDAKVNQLATDVSSMDRRLLRIETMIEMTQTRPGRRSLPGGRQ